MLFALFEQLALLPKTKKILTKNDRLKYYCKGLVTKLTAEQADKLLTFLLSNKSFYPSAKAMLEKRTKTNTDLHGYKRLYFELVTGDNADAAQRDILVDISGVLLEVMTPVEAKKLFDHLVDAKDYDTLETTLSGIRDSGQHLSKEIVERLVQLFTTEATNDPELKKQLFSEHFNTLRRILLPSMTDDQRLALVNDDTFRVTTNLVKTIFPRDGKRKSAKPLFHVSSELHKRLFLYATRDANPNAVDHLLSVADHDTQKMVLTNYINDLNYGLALLGVILEQDIFVLINHELDTVKPIIDTMMENSALRKHIGPLVLAALNVDIKNNKYTDTEVREDIIDYILQHKTLGEQGRTNILKYNNEIMHNSIVSDKIPLELLSTFLAFGCRPNIDDIRSDYNPMNLALEFNRINRKKNIAKIKKVVSSLDHVSIDILYVTIKALRSDVFDWLLTKAIEKKPAFKDTPELLKLFDNLFTFAYSEEATPRAVAIFNSLVQHGIAPAYSTIERIRQYDSEKLSDEQKDAMIELVQTHTPQSLVEGFNGEEKTKKEKPKQKNPKEEKNEHNDTSKDHSQEHALALTKIKERIAQQEKRDSRAKLWSLIGLLLPIISHFIILIVYLATKDNVTKLQFKKADFLAFKRNKHPTFDFAKREHNKPVIKESKGDAKTNTAKVQRKLIDYKAGDAKNSDSVALLFPTKKQAKKFQSKFKQWQTESAEKTMTPTKS